MRNWLLNFDLIWPAHNVSDVHVVFHMVTDASVYNGNINSRHPVVMGLRNVLKVASMSSVSTVTGRSKTWKIICQRLVYAVHPFFLKKFLRPKISLFCTCNLIFFQSTLAMGPGILVKYINCLDFIHHVKFCRQFCRDFLPESIFDTLM